MMVATEQGVVVVFAAGFVAGGVSAWLARVLGRAWDRWRADDADPLEDPKNWH